jgi:hypothetical protein
MQASKKGKLHLPQSHVWSINGGGTEKKATGGSELIEHQQIYLP